MRLFYVLECFDGKYGSNCSVDCGHCKDGVTCNHGNGNCETDTCDKGWKGHPICKTGRLFLILLNI